MCSIETGHPYEVEHRILGADGVYRWFHVRGLPLRDAEGRIVRWYNLVTDIEDRRRAEERVLTSEQSLRQIDKYLGDATFEALWAELDRRHAVVFVHPALPLPPVAGVAGPLVDYPFDTTRRPSNSC
jgi:hypothetical protein